MHGCCIHGCSTHNGCGTQLVKTGDFNTIFSTSGVSCSNSDRGSGVVVVGVTGAIGVSTPSSTFPDLGGLSGCSSSSTLPDFGVVVVVAGLTGGTIVVVVAIVVAVVGGGLVVVVVVPSSSR